MNIISFSGPRGAGKGAIIDALLVRFEKEFPGMVSRAITITDRGIRPGEVEGKNIITCSKEEFQSLENEGKILFPKVIPNSPTGIEYKNGVFPSELDKTKVALLDMHGASVNLLKEYLALNNGEIKSVFVYTKPECRKIRIASREGHLFSEMTEMAMGNENNVDLEQESKNYDFVVVNPEGELSETVEKIYSSLRPFVEEFIKK